MYTDPAPVGTLCFRQSFGAISDGAAAASLEAALLCNSEAEAIHFTANCEIGYYYDLAVVIKYFFQVWEEGWKLADFRSQKIRRGLTCISKNC